MAQIRFTGKTLWNKNSPHAASADLQFDSHRFFYRINAVTFSHTQTILLRDGSSCNIWFIRKATSQDASTCDIQHKQCKRSSSRTSCCHSFTPQTDSVFIWLQHQHDTTPRRTSPAERELAARLRVRRPPCCAGIHGTPSGSCKQAAVARRLLLGSITWLHILLESVLAVPTSLCLDFQSKRPAVVHSQECWEAWLVFLLLHLKKPCEICIYSMWMKIDFISTMFDTPKPVVLKVYTFWL